MIISQRSNHGPTLFDRAAMSSVPDARHNGARVTSSLDHDSTVDRQRRLRLTRLRSTARARNKARIPGNHRNNNRHIQRLR